MAALVDCPGCQWGEHEKHDPKHGVIPGLIGGTVCACSGDCAERFERAREEWLAKWVHPFADTSDMDEPPQSNPPGQDGAK
jgi:hypothetical protein